MKQGGIGVFKCSVEETLEPNGNVGWGGGGGGERLRSKILYPTH